MPPVGRAGPHPIGPHALVVHVVPIRKSVDEIFWHAEKLRLGVGEWVVRVRWLIGFERSTGKAASYLELHFGGVVPVREPVLRFGGRW